MQNNEGLALAAGDAGVAIGFVIRTLRADTWDFGGPELELESWIDELMGAGNLLDRIKHIAEGGEDED